MHKTDPTQIRGHNMHTTAEIHQYISSNCLFKNDSKFKINDSFEYMTETCKQRRIFQYIYKYINPQNLCQPNLFDPKIWLK